MLSQDDIGGTELMVAMLMNQLAARGVHAELAVLAKPGLVSNQMAENGFKVFGARAWGLLGGARGFAALLRSRDYDVINVYGFKASLIVRVLARGLNTDPVILCGVQGWHVTEVENIKHPKARFAMLIERLTWQMLDGYEANSHGALEVLADHRIPRSRLHYIPNGIDLQQWPPRGPATPCDIPLIVCTARFIGRKRQEDLLRAVSMLLQRDVSCRLLLIGDGPDRAAMRQVAGNLGLSEVTQFPGSLPASAIRDYLLDATVFCLPSLWEGMPAALMEAMARRVPVVATKVNGITDLVEDGRTGRLVPPMRPELLADAIEQLIRDPDLAERLANAGRARIEAEHTLDHLASAKLDLYRQLVGSKSTPIV